jgi:hypothetical protein
MNETKYYAVATIAFAGACFALNRHMSILGALGGLVGVLAFINALRCRKTVRG